MAGPASPGAEAPPAMGGFSREKSGSSGKSRTSSSITVFS